MEKITMKLLIANKPILDIRLFLNSSNFVIWNYKMAGAYWGSTGIYNSLELHH